jgi:hypothetical protein
MLPMPVMVVLLLSRLMFSLSGQQAQQPESNMVRAKARVVEQKYCRGDADTFTVSFGLEIEIENPSKTAVHVLWPMVPWVGKVASSIGDAEAGRFLYEQTASHYPQSPTHFERLKLEPGSKVSKRSEYYLIARRDAAFSLPKSVSAGTYAVVLVFSPEDEPPAQMAGPDTIRSITTEPFLVEVPAAPKLVRGEAAGAKAR